MKLRFTQDNPCFIVLTAIILLMVYPISEQDVISADNKIHYTKNTYTYKIVDNCKIRADVYRYPDEKIRPAIIWIHGGALIFGSRNSLPSAGGYLILMAGFRLKPHPRALVSFYGYGDITGTWYARPDSFYNQRPTVSKDQAFTAIGDSVISVPLTRDRWQFYIYCRQKGLWPREISGHDPEKERAWYSAYELLRNVTLAYSPTILLHGEKDTDVPFEQSVLMAEALKRRGVDYEFITNPDWGHRFDGSGMENPAVAPVRLRLSHILIVDSVGR